MAVFWSAPAPSPLPRTWQLSWPLAFLLLLGCPACTTTSRSGLGAAPTVGGLNVRGSLVEMPDRELTLRINRSRSIDLSRWISDPALQVQPKQEGDGVVDATTGAGFWKGRFRPLFARRLSRGEAGTRILVSLRNGGLVFTDDEGSTWRRSTGLPRRFVPEDYGGPVLFRDVEDVWQNPKQPAHLLAVVKHRLLESRDGGVSFQEMPDTGIRANYTAVAARVNAAGELSELFLGTSVHGVYRIWLNRGAYRKGGYAHTFRGLPYERHDARLWLFDEVVGLAVEEPTGMLQVAVRFQGGLYEARIGTAREQMTFARSGPENLPDAENIHALGSVDGRTVLSGSGGLYIREVGAAGARPGWRFVSADAAYGSVRRFAALLFDGPGRISVQRFVSERSHSYPDPVRAIYVSPTTAKSRQRELFKLLGDYPFNAAVIDVKDDFGRLVYGSSLPEAKAMGNDRERAPIRQLARDLKARGLYLIARVVVFKDSRLYSYDRGRYALVDYATGAPWQGSDVERWVDTYSTFVQNYNIRVAREVLALGFDEIQFDYIRFPSDGPVHRIRWRHRRGNAYKSEALEAFLRKARANISAPISVDIYGYNGMYRVAGLVGQDLVDLGDYVDVVSPMHYSSHYGPLYLEATPRARRTFTLLQMGTQRPRLMGAGRFSVRPWVQCFQLLTGRWGWGPQYMRDQIEGVLAGKGTGVLWWGPLRLFHIPGSVHKAMESARTSGGSPP